MFTDDNNQIVKPAFHYFDKQTVITGCTVEILENTRTGETSTAWFPIGKYPEVEQDAITYEEYAKQQENRNE